MNNSPDSKARTMTDVELRRAIRKYEGPARITSEEDEAELIQVLAVHHDLGYFLRMFGSSSGFGATIAAISLRIQALEQKKAEWDLGFAP